MVGDIVGSSVGDIVGLIVGSSVGLIVGVNVGDCRCSRLEYASHTNEIHDSHIILNYLQ